MNHATTERIAMMLFVFLLLPIINGFFGAAGGFIAGLIWEGTIDDVLHSMGLHALADQPLWKVGVVGAVLGSYVRPGIVEVKK